MEEEHGKRRSGAHSGLILTFHSGPGLPVSFQMNGNCPAGFNHVLNWLKNRGESASAAIENRSHWKSTYCWSVLSARLECTRAHRARACTTLHERTRVRTEDRGTNYSDSLVGAGGEFTES